MLRIRGFSSVELIVATTLALMVIAIVTFAMFPKGENLSEAVTDDKSLPRFLEQSFSWIIPGVEQTNRYTIPTLPVYEDEAYSK